MILAGVPFDNPTKFISLDGKVTVDAEPLAQFATPRKPTIGNVTLKIDCSNLGASAIETLAACLRKFLAVNIIAGDTIYATGEISTRHYNEIWQTIDLFDCKVIC